MSSIAKLVATTVKKEAREVEYVRKKEQETQMSPSTDVIGPVGLGLIYGGKEIKT